MFRLKVKVGRRWKIGIVTYDSYDDAMARVEDLKNKGISSKVVSKTGANL